VYVYLHVWPRTLTEELFKNLFVNVEFKTRTSVFVTFRLISLLPDADFSNTSNFCYHAQNTESKHKICYHFRPISGTSPESLSSIQPKNDSVIYHFVDKLVRGR